MIRYFRLDPVRSLPYALNAGLVEVRVSYTDDDGARRHSVRGSEWLVPPGGVVRFDDADRDLLRGIESVADDTGARLFVEVAPTATTVDVDDVLRPVRAARDSRRGRR